MSESREVSQFGLDLAMHRKRAKLSISELARRANVPRQHIVRIEAGERGNRVSLDVARRLADGLQIPLYELRT